MEGIENEHWIKQFGVLGHQTPIPFFAIHLSSRNSRGGLRRFFHIRNSLPEGACSPTHSSTCLPAGPVHHFWFIKNGARGWLASTGRIRCIHMRFRSEYLL